MLKVFVFSVAVVVALVAGLYVWLVDDESTELLVQSAAGGSVTDNGDGSFTLMLEGVDSILWFSERPGRHAGSMSLDDFARNWQDFVSDDPPNAALEANGFVHAVALTDVTLDASTATLTYRVEPLEEDPAGSTRGQADLTAMDFDRAFLFIDALPTSVNSQITD